MAVVVRFNRGIDAEHHVESLASPPRPFNRPGSGGGGGGAGFEARDVEDLFAGQAQGLSRVAWQDYCNGSTPIPIRLERWMRSKLSASTARTPSSVVPFIRPVTATTQNRTSLPASTTRGVPLTRHNAPGCVIDRGHKHPLWARK